MIENIRFYDRTLYDLREHAKLSMRLTTINDLEFAHVLVICCSFFCVLLDILETKNESTPLTHLTTTQIWSNF